MHRNKTDMKGATALAAADMGTRLNLTGLTDYMFDAMCSADNHIYPFVCNLETNITRIAPAWNEYFDMGLFLSMYLPVLRRYVPEWLTTEIQFEVN